MSGVTATDYAWFDTEFGGLCTSGHCLTFVRDMSPEEAFIRIKVPAERPVDGHEPSCDRPITAYAAIGGTVLLEAGGHAGTLAEVTRRLSTGTAMASVLGARGRGGQFVFAADGRLVTGFELGATGARWGAAPDRLLTHMLDLGIPADTDTDTDTDTEDRLTLASLALAERATGVRITSAHLARPALTGSAAHLY